jgi:tetratricopeptide (TPR) repeat protein
MALESDRLAEGIAPGALDDHDGPAKRLTPGELDAAVSAAVSRALPPKTHLSRRTVQALLIAATLCLAGVSAALIAARAFDDDRSPPASDPARGAPPAERSEPRISPAPSHPELVASSEVRAPSEGESGARAPSAADLLKAANELRRQGRWAEAERAYSQVATRYGATGQGPVAALAAASLRLEHLGDPKGALRLYQSALGASSLSAEAELGIANSYRALGDRDAELRTLRRLASAYPNAAFHERVEARLRALETGKP